MSSKLTKRGAVFWIVGTIRVGKTSVRIRETTGCRDKTSAQVIYTRRCAEISEQLLRGEKPAKSKAIPGFATAAADYVDAKAKGSTPLGNQDRQKLLRLGKFFEEKPVNSFEPEDWDKFVAEKLDDPAPATVRRWYAMFSPPLVRTAEKFKLTLPKFVLPSDGAVREIFLESEDRDGLLAEYADHAKPIALTLCLQGCRESEALRLQWPDVSLSRDTVTFRKTKNGDMRVAPMHPEVRATLEKMHNLQTSGPVFVKPDGTPYVDRRSASHGEGRDGSGIRKAHATALRRFTIKKLLKDQKTCLHCGAKLSAAPGGPANACVELAVVRPAGEREELSDYALSCASCHKTCRPELVAKINWFRIHDWRHHWASWAVMDGVDAPSLMVLGGWKSPKMVQRYVKLAVGHLAIQLARSQRRRGGNGA